MHGPQVNPAGVVERFRCSPYEVQEGLVFLNGTETHARCALGFKGNQLSLFTFRTDEKDAASVPSSQNLAMVSLSIAMLGALECFRLKDNQA